MIIPLLQFRRSSPTPTIPGTRHFSFLANTPIFYWSALDVPLVSPTSHPFLLASSHAPFWISYLLHPLPTVPHSRRTCSCFFNITGHHSYFFLSTHILSSWKCFVCFSYYTGASSKAEFTEDSLIHLCTSNYFRTVL